MLLEVKYINGFVILTSNYKIQLFFNEFHFWSYVIPNSIMADLLCTVMISILITASSPLG